MSKNEKIDEIHEIWPSLDLKKTMKENFDLAKEEIIGFKEGPHDYISKWKFDKFVEEAIKINDKMLDYIDILKSNQDLISNLYKKLITHFDSLATNCNVKFHATASSLDMLNSMVAVVCDKVIPGYDFKKFHDEISKEGMQ